MFLIMSWRERERESLKSMFYFWSVLLCFLWVDAKMGYG